MKQHTTTCIMECNDDCKCKCHIKDIVTDIEREFLEESNHIENVWDFRSLDQAVAAWEYLRAHPKLNTHVVLKTHKILMLHQPGLMPNEKGYFRTVPVYIGGRKCEVTNAEGWPLTTVISQWCHQANQSPERWKIMHIEYEKIHPFIDGNVRTGRMLMNWQRLKAGLPILVIKEKEKYEYYNWFN